MHYSCPSPDHKKTPKRNNTPNYKRTPKVNKRKTNKRKDYF